MYKVAKNGKSRKTLFENYEAARQYIRKQMRKQFVSRESRQPLFPMIFAGYTIRKI
jgi:D-serine dehydratase